MQHHQLLNFFALLVFAFGLFARIAERKSDEVQADLADS